MSPRSDGFRVHALTAEASARASSDPEVKRQFLDIARSWHALAEMANKGKIVKIVAAPELGTELMEFAFFRCANARHKPSHRLPRNIFAICREPSGTGWLLRLYFIAF